MSKLKSWLTWMKPTQYYKMGKKAKSCFYIWESFMGKKNAPRTNHFGFGRNGAPKY